MPETQSLSLSVGDRVVYPKQGVCRVAARETKEVAGQKLTFFTMRREEDGAVMMVPEGKVQSIGLRKVAGQDEVKKVFTFLTEDTDKADLDWKQRARANLDRMSQGGLKGLAEVVKGLQVLSELRPLPAKERELYDTARHLLVMEISASLGVEECDAEDSLDVALFPPGKERPKRTAADFKAPGGEGEEEGEGLEVPEDLMEMGGDLELPPEERDAEAGAEEAPEAEGEAKAPKKAKLSDDEVTLTGTALPAAPAPKKRDRPPKVKPILPSDKAAAAKTAKAELPPAPKKRGRPPKAKPAAPAKAAKKASKKK